MSWESISHLASLTGVATNTVKKRCEGLPTRKGKRRAILLESRDALPLILQVRGTSPLDVGTKDQHERLAMMRADKEELLVAELRGELIRTDAAVRAWQHILTAVRAKLLAMPNRMAIQLAPLEDATECQDLIEAAVHEALGELSETGLPDEIAERLGQGAGGFEAAAEANG